MATVHGSKTVFTVDGNDLSTYCNTSEIVDRCDVHDTTGYGATGHGKDAGLRDPKITVGGTYDSTASTGPRAVMRGALGTKVTIIRQIEGAGSGLPQDSASAVVSKYVETSPVADMVRWSGEFDVDGIIDDTAQT